ncbi:MAG: exopolysaccharide biosynthesis protein [Aquisalinus sp.]|nr:exopolysaccharide biosynthesis protein [Aquisalinus sp.]
MIREEAPLEDIITTVIEDADGDQVHFGDLLEEFGSRSFGPILIILGLLVILPPLGAIPGLPAIVGAIVLLFSLQLLAGRSHIWVPNNLRELSVDREKLKAAEKRSKKWLSFIDSFVEPRFEFATGKLATRLAALAVSMLALAMIPLELVPFAVAVPGAAMVFFGMALVARDGLMMLLAFAITTLAGWLVLSYAI